MLLCNSEFRVLSSRAQTVHSLAHELPESRDPYPLTGMCELPRTGSASGESTKTRHACGSGKGSFDCETASLREAVSPLRMTDPVEQHPYLRFFLFTAPASLTP